jgi:hypothetical protein
MAAGAATVNARPSLRYAIFRFASPPDWLQAKMVLPVRIELTTSALPRMRSTTELRQHIGHPSKLLWWDRFAGKRGAYGRSFAKLSRKPE